MMKLDITLGEEALSGIPEIIKHIRPAWSHENIAIKAMKGGHVNRLFYCGLRDDVEETDGVVVRAFGKGLEAFHDPEKEFLVMKIGHHVNLAAPVYCRFNNGIVYKYQPGVTVDFTNQTEEAFARGVAKDLAKLHTTDYKKILDDLGENDKADMFKTRFNPTQFLPMLLSTVPESYDVPHKEAIRVKELMTKTDVLAEVNRLENAIGALNLPIILCHNDVNTGNIIYNKQTGQTHFVDWEVAGLNYAINDISSFFISHVYNFEVKCSPDQFQFYPDIDYQMKWIRWYLEHKDLLSGEDPNGITEEQVQTLLIGTNLAAMSYSLCTSEWCLSQDVKPSVAVDYFGIAVHLQGVYRLIKGRMGQSC